jgi:hypothetical protein
MRTPSAPGTAEARAFQAAFEAVDLARFSARQPVSPPSSGLQDAALRAARLRLIMAGRLQPEPAMTLRPAGA